MHFVMTTAIKVPRNFESVRPLGKLRQKLDYNQERLEGVIRAWADGYARNPWLSEEAAEMQMVVRSVPVNALDRQALAEKLADANTRVKEALPAQMIYSGLDLKRILSSDALSDQFSPLWQLLQRPLLEIKEYLNEAYTKAFAPVIAAAIQAQGLALANILVVGCGNLHFSRMVLPAVEQLLFERGSYTLLNVTESDVEECITKLPGKTKQADVTRLAEIFPENRFNVVVGESMIHAVPRAELAEALKQIARVSTGPFIHLQDSMPPPNTYGEGLAPYQADVQKARSRENESEMLIAILALAKKAHDNLTHAVEKAAAKSHLASKVLPVEGSDLIDENRKLPAGLDYPEFRQKRHLISQLGFNTFPKDETPPSKKRITFQGRVMLVSKN